MGEKKKNNQKCGGGGGGGDVPPPNDFYVPDTISTNLLTMVDNILYFLGFKKRKRKRQPELSPLHKFVVRSNLQMYVLKNVTDS